MPNVLLELLHHFAAAVPDELRQALVDELARRAVDVLARWVWIWLASSLRRRARRPGRALPETASRRRPSRGCRGWVAGASLAVARRRARSLACRPGRAADVARQKFGCPTAPVPRPPRSAHRRNAGPSISPNGYLAEKHGGAGWGATCQGRTPRRPSLASGKKLLTVPIND